MSNVIPVSSAAGSAHIKLTGITVSGAVYIALTVVLGFGKAEPAYRSPNWWRVRRCRVRRATMPPETTAMATPMRMRLVRSTLCFSSPAPPRARSAADDAAVVGARLGHADGTAVVGDRLGHADGTAVVGDRLGHADGTAVVGDRLCHADGTAVVGNRLGHADGTAAGAVLPGAAVGSAVGNKLGDADGTAVVGNRLGHADGTAAGAVLPVPGAAVGSAVGDQVWQSAWADRVCRKAIPATGPAPPEGRKAMPAGIPAEPTVKPTPWALPRRVSRRCIGLRK